MGAVRNAVLKDAAETNACSKTLWHPCHPHHCKKGHVTLEGVVDSEADKNKAYLRANRVPGVFSVENQLQVKREK